MPGLEWNKNSTLNIDPEKVETTTNLPFERETSTCVKRSKWWRREKAFYNIRFMHKTMIIIILSSQLIYCHSSFFFVHLLYNWNFFNTSHTLWSRVSNFSAELCFEFWLAQAEGSFSLKRWNLSRGLQDFILPQPKFVNHRLVFDSTIWFQLSSLSVETFFYAIASWAADRTIK